MTDFKAKMQKKIYFGPDPTGGAYSAPPDHLAGFKGPTSKGKGGEVRGRGARPVCLLVLTMLATGLQAAQLVGSVIIIII